jgi:NAD-dependent deacetylase
MTALRNSIDMKIRCASDILRGSKRGVVLSGAGISTPSGIPDFRSVHSGLWDRYDPMKVASLNSFRYHPEDFFNWLRSLAKDMYMAQPNAAHYGVAQLEEAGFIQTVITQNIDALHTRAGSKQVLEVHGSMRSLTCIQCYSKVDAAPFWGAYLEDGQMPRCPSCGGILKPDLVLFGEQLPHRTWLAAQEASRNSDVMLVAGSSLEVLPVAGLPMRALENGAHLILINHSETYLDVRADVVFHEDVEEIIPRLVEHLASSE